jgi:hypothetical protein
MKAKGCLRAAAWVLSAVSVAASFGLPVAQADPCVVVGIGVDTSRAGPTSYVGVRCGAAPGETFVATDTLIHSIAVWRPAVETPYGGHFKLWITGVDSLGAPQIEQVVLEGPVITVPFGDGVHPIKMEYLFDPPFALPRPGKYYFAVQDYCGGHWDLLISTDDAYMGGNLWRSGISCFSGCYLGREPDGFPTYDLVFTIEFCRNVITPVSTSSWGKLKATYR